ncbi:MAG: T9SS type A sorting domain-containing protein [Bacteroidales bacterium]|nr:T9SS type A sorting domain-containing protein [Bacteroidales bacterium]
MVRKLFSLMVMALLIQKLVGQFPPPAGQEGTTAIHADSSAFIAWAVNCQVERGFLNIAWPDSGFVSFGSDAHATGAPDNAVVSLGDAGTAVLTFNEPIVDGPGFDFAVFENSFSDDYLELAFVEVSSDGVNFVRFDAVSLTQTTLQVDAFGLIETEKINNLAGKYRLFYGTPFNLEELEGMTNLDINHVTHVRIADVTGCIQDSFASFDSQGNRVNDPWPTAFPSGGFDLDAIGVIHNKSHPGISEDLFRSIEVYPNPAGSYIVLKLPPSWGSRVWINVFDITGKQLSSFSCAALLSETGKIRMDISCLPVGLYFISIHTGDASFTGKFLKQ